MEVHENLNVSLLFKDVAMVYIMPFYMMYCKNVSPGHESLIQAQWYMQHWNE